MDPLIKLKYEFKGIKDTLLKYTSKGNVRNFLDGLDNAMKSNDFQGILYFLEQLCKWYEMNIQEIHNNEFSFDDEEHDRNMKILCEINEELKYIEPLKSNNKENIRLSNKTTSYSKIFISHCSDDKKYGDALEKFIVGLGVKNNQLIYTSHPLHKIPTNENIYEYLKKNINKNIYVIFLWSNSYLESIACLNEMGAAWISESDYTNVFVPNFDFNNPKFYQCAVDTKKMGIILKNNSATKAGMIDLKNKILKSFDLQIDESTVVFLIDNFMKDIE